MKTPYGQKKKKTLIKLHLLVIMLYRSMHLEVLKDYVMLSQSQGSLKNLRPRTRNGWRNGTGTLCYK